MYRVWLKSTITYDTTEIIENNKDIVLVYFRGQDKGCYPDKDDKLNKYFNIELID